MFKIMISFYQLVSKAKIVFTFPTTMPVSSSLNLFSALTFTPSEILPVDLDCWGEGSQGYMCTRLAPRAL